jgi:hypothetical protein
MYRGTCIIVCTLYVYMYMYMYCNSVCMLRYIEG